MSSYDPEVTRSLYAIVLAANGKAPNLPTSDEEEVMSATAPAKKGKDKKEASEEESDKKVVVKIDAEDIYNRIIPLKLEARNYIGLAKGPKHKLFVAESIPNQPNLTIHSYDVEKMKAEEFGDKIAQFIPSADR
jgi:tricorn protease